MNARFYIHTVNQSMEARDDGADYSSIEQARRKAIDAAAGIACHELTFGKASVIVEAIVRDASNAVYAKVAVAICVGDLQITHDT